MQPKSLRAPLEIKRTVTMVTPNNSSTQHPADGQHAPGGRCTGAIFFQNIKKEGEIRTQLMFLNVKKMIVQNAHLFRCLRVSSSDVWCPVNSFALSGKKITLFLIAAFRRSDCLCSAIVCKDVLGYSIPSVHSHKFLKMLTNLFDVLKWSDLIRLGMQHIHAVISRLPSKGNNSSITAISPNLQVETSTGRQ